MAYETHIKIHNILKHKRAYIYYINITFPERVIVENIIPRNVIINRGAAEVDNHISTITLSGNVIYYFIIPNTTLDFLFSTVCFLLDLPW